MKSQVPCIHDLTRSSMFFDLNYSKQILLVETLSVIFIRSYGIMQDVLLLLRCSVPENLDF